MTSTTTVVDCVTRFGGYEPLSDMVALAFPDLEVPTCNLSTTVGKRRLRAFLESRPEVMRHLGDRLENVAPPPSSLGSLGVPDSPLASVRSEGEGVRLLPQESEAKEEEAQEGPTDDSASRYVKEVESGRDRAYMRAVQNLQVASIRGPAWAVGPWIGGLIYEAASCLISVC